MVYKRSLGETVFSWLSIGLMLTLCFVTLYLFIYTLFASLSDPTEMARFRGMLLYRRNVYFSSPIMLIIIITMVFHGGLIPSFLLINNLGMLNTPWALLLPGAINSFNLIIMRTAFQGIPVSLEESARIDGANDWTILIRILLPLSMPVVAVMILWYAVGHWNSYFNALIYLRDRELFPLQLVLKGVSQKP
ncbi:L-arabinose transport system permease protein AraQ [compost metagenome]